MGPAPDLLDRRLLFFTGKGGVGKTTMAAATAILAADRGRRVLLVDVDGKGDIAALFEHAPVGFKPVQVHPGVLAMAMDTEASLQEYLRLNLKVPVLGRLGPLAPRAGFRRDGRAGREGDPHRRQGLWETREAIEGRADFDLVVVDASASGHIVAQLGAPAAIQDLVDVGPVRSQTDWLVELLSDPAITGVNVVTTPEEMPVAETIELVARLRAEVTAPLATVIVNRVLPELFTTADEETFSAIREPAVAAALARSAGGGTTAVLDGARLAVSLRRSGAVHLAELDEQVDLPLLYVPYLFAARAGPPRPAHGGRRARRGARAVSAPIEAGGANGLEQLLAAKEIAIFCGSGGVGKTSVAAASALGAVSRLGGKVLVLTIDPARRLATALGLDGVGNLARRVPPELLKAAGIEPRGELYAAMLDTKQSWDELVLRHAPTRRPRTGSSRTGCITTSPHGSCRATTTSRWSASTSCTRAVSTTSSSSTLHRRATPPTSSRHRSAWPTSSVAGCCAGSRCRTAWVAAAGAACSTPRAAPSIKLPIASSGVSSSRTSPSSSSTSSRCTTGSARGRRRSSGCSTTGGRRSSW